jgi:hypothetical protein
MWAGDKKLAGGKCKVNCTQSCLPKESGGLDIPNLEKFTRALQLRCLWHRWVSNDKPWVGIETSCDDDELLFVAYTTITLGDKGRASFWESGWWHRPKDIVPILFDISRQKVIRSRCAQQRQLDLWPQHQWMHKQWVNDHVTAFVELWSLVHKIQLPIGRCHHLETHQIMRVLCRLGLQGAIPLLHCNSVDKHYLEILGTP